MLYKGDTLYLDWLEDGIAELVFDAPGSVNKLDTATARPSACWNSNQI